MILGKLKLKIATVITVHRSAGKIETKDRRGREGGIAIFSELKIADFPGLCVASLRASFFLCTILLLIIGRPLKSFNCHLLLLIFEGLKPTRN